jgi:hypothetical protein
MLAGGCAASVPDEGAIARPAAARQSLLAADSALGRSAVSTDLVSAITGAMAPDVALLGGGRIARGIDSARALLRGNPENARSVMRWAPIGGGVSGDGRHGYTYGYASWRRPDGATVHAKYVAYWVRPDGEWRVRVYKRTGRAGSRALPDPRPYIPPVAGTTPHDSATAAAEVRASELAFSRRAGEIGLAESFRINAAADAAHTGAPTDTGFRLGPDEIADGLRGAEAPLGSITWAPEEVHVAPSGDLGVTIGLIRIAPADPTRPPPPPAPFFTVWKRVGSGARWKFVVE